MVSYIFSKLVILLLITGAICCCCCCCRGQGGGGDGGTTIRCIQSERRALLAILSNMSSNGLSGETFSSWTGEDCCGWRGVACDNTTGRVTVLDLYFSQLVGQIPESLGSDLAHLVSLNLSNNNITGGIPESLGKLVRLQEVRLSDNHISGQIPETIGNLPNLGVLYLEGNSITGQIPRTMGDLCNLTELDLSNNKIYGELTDLLDGLSRCAQGTPLSSLNVQGNNLSGRVPTSLGKLSRIQNLRLSSNSLHGDIAGAHFSNLTDLYFLDISSNPLNVMLSSDWIPPFNNLFYIDMSYCHLSEFPNWIRNQTGFRFLYLSSVGLSGNLPVWFSDLELAAVFLDSNNLTGPLPHLGSIITWINLSDNSFVGPIPLNVDDGSGLYFLLLSHNKLNGSIPSSLCNLTALEVLDLSDNNLTGEFPNCSNSFPNNLLYLHLNKNKLSGRFPSFLRNCGMLTTLDMGQNRFSGEIPTWVGSSFELLKILRLSSNSFTGAIPVIAVLTDLQVLDLSSNNLSGEVPPSLRNLTSIIARTNTGDSFGYDGYLESILITTKGMVIEYTPSVLNLVASIDLSKNDLSGEIPTELTELLGLIFLNLSRNHITGRIPENIGRLTRLESLDLSWNSLAGEIPSGISDLHFLSHLNLSYNNLSGRIPTGSQLSTLNDSSIYVGNGGLCGMPLPQCRDVTNEAPSDAGDKENGDKMEKIFQIISIILGFAVGFWAYIGTIFTKQNLRVALFRSIDRSSDWIYVRLALKYRRLKSKWQRT